MSNTITKETKASIGLGNVDNTSDANKPVSTATQTALDAKLALAGGTMSGDLEFSGAAALEIADNAYIFKTKTDNDVGFYYNSTDACIDVKSTTAVANSRVYTESGITRFGGKRVSSDFTKTTDTTLAVITGLSLSLLAGKNYKFKALLFVDADVTGGIKLAIDTPDTLTITNLIYKVTLIDESTDAFTVVTRGSALGATFTNAGTTAGVMVIEGLIEVNAAGTFEVQFAQSVSNLSSTVLRGSSLTIEEVA